MLIAISFSFDNRLMVDEYIGKKTSSKNSNLFFSFKKCFFLASSEQPFISCYKNINRTIEDQYNCEISLK